MLSRSVAKANPVNLPNFCQPQAVLLLVLLGAVLALIITLAGMDGIASFWLQFGLTLLFIQTVMLSACLVLCGARQWLNRLSVGPALILIFVFIQLLVVLYTWISLAAFPALQSTESQSGIEFLMLRNVSISILASLVFMRYLVLHRQWQLQVRAEATSRLSALQARIRPHFLFNALNTVASLIPSRPEQAEQAVLDLSDLLRTGLKDQPRHTVGEELELIRGYLRIEALRLGERLDVQWSLDDQPPFEHTIPALLIQPLVENAVLHGIAQKTEGGVLSITSEWKSNTSWIIEIANPVPDQQKDNGKGHGMSLDNINKRLALAFEDEARLQLVPGEHTMTVRLTLPMNRTRSS